MGRKIIIAAAVVLSIGVLVRTFSTPGRAQNVEQATERLDKTEHQLSAEVKDSNNTAKDVATDLTDGQDRLPGALAEFGKSTQRLHELRAELAKDIASYDAARNSKLADLDNELKQIKDASTRRHMERLRTRAQHQTTEALQNAQAALASLESVLAQGTDLQHAAKCVQIADELQLQGTDLTNQVQRAKEHVATYSRLSNNLLAQLTTTTTTTD
jgi:hypothetical protein